MNKGAIVDLHPIENITVPFMWIITGICILLVILGKMLLSWIKAGFRRNDDEHKHMWRAISRGFDRLQGRLDHLIIYHKEVPDYPKSRDERIEYNPDDDDDDDTSISGKFKRLF